MHKVSVYKEQPEVDTTLDKLGLQIHELQEAAKANFLAQAACTANDAPTAPGFIGWNASVRALREFLIPKGWTREDIKNSPRITSSEQDVTIMVATGDEATGNPMATPKTKSNKGTTTRNAINNNENQVSLFSEEMIPHTMPAKSINQANGSTWLLLVHVHIDQQSEDPKHIIRCELSLPVGMDQSGHITAWSERIILPEITVDPDNITTESAEYAPEQEIILKRKA